MRPPEVRLHCQTNAPEGAEVLRMRFIPYPKKERRPGGPLLPLQFKEGWVELSRAEEAEALATRLNGNPVECRRTRRCFGQLWTVQYLRGTNWDELVEEREGERRMRKTAEVTARREEKSANEAYRRAVLKSMAERKKRKAGGQRPVATSGAEQEATASTEDTAPSTSSAPAPAHPSSKKGKAADKVKTRDETKKRPTSTPKGASTSALPKKKNSRVASS